MQSTQAIARAAISRAVVVDLIGDLDTTLGTLFADTLVAIAPDAGRYVFVSTKHVAQTTRDGLARLDTAISAARSRGCAVALEAGNRRMKTALSFARISCESLPSRPMTDRHVMIAHRTATP